MSRVWSEENKFASWLKVEIAAVQAWADIVGACLQFVTGCAILEPCLATRGVAVGKGGARQQQRHHRRQRYTHRIDHAGTSGPGFFT